LTRLFYQLREAGILGTGSRSTPTRLLVIPMEGTMNHALDISTKARQRGIPTEVYFNEGKMKKKFGYADRLGIPYVLVIGEDEVRTGMFALKDMKSGTQETMDVDSVVEKVRTSLQD